MTAYTRLRSPCPHKLGDTSDTRLATESVCLGYGGAPVIEDLTTQIPDGAVTAIVGANACGKSTLLRGLARLLRPSAGTVTLDGHPIANLPTKRVAQMLGFLPQHPSIPEGVRVADLAGRGRHPHQRAFHRWSAHDDAIIAAALHQTGSLEIADRYVDELSGGQRQRVWIAMALAQQTDIMLLDEPTTYLDVAHQIDVLDLLAALNCERGTTIVMVLHELNMAARYADHLIAMCDGAIVAAGPPADIITPELVREVFGINCTIMDDPVSHTPMVIAHSTNRGGSL